MTMRQRKNYREQLQRAETAARMPADFRVTDLRSQSGARQPCTGKGAVHRIIFAGSRFGRNPPISAVRNPLPGCGFSP